MLVLPRVYSLQEAKINLIGQILIEFQRQTHMNESLISLIKFSLFKISGKIGKNIPWQNFLVFAHKYFCLLYSLH